MKKIVYISLFVLLLVATSCKKEEQLIGEWQQVSFSEEKFPDAIFWKFESGNKLIIKGMGKYEEENREFSFSLKRSKLNIYSTDGDNSDFSKSTPDERGEYWIDELSRDYLKVTRVKWPDGSDGAEYLRIELVKKN